MCLAVRILDSFKTWKPYFMVDCEFETDWEKWKTKSQKSALFEKTKISYVESKVSKTMSD